MTQITEALKRIAIQCRVKEPSSWVTATRQDHVSIRDVFLLEAIDDILERVDLPAPIGGLEVVSGTVQSYGLPSDFKRLHRSPLSVYDSGQDQPCVAITTDGQWAYLKDVGPGGPILYYRLSGYEGNWEIEFNRAPSADVSIHFQRTDWMRDTSSNENGSAFTSEDDILLLPQRLVEAGTVWRFRRDKGLPYEDTRMEFETLLARMSNDRRVRRRITDETNEGWRWQDEIPAFIPSS